MLAGAVLTFAAAGMSCMAEGMADKQDRRGGRFTTMAETLKRAKEEDIQENSRSAETASHQQLWRGSSMLSCISQTSC